MRRLGLALVCILVFLTACGSSDVETTEPASQEKIIAENVELEMWTFPVGNINSSNVLPALIQKYNTKHPNVTVNLRTLDYKTGDAVVEDAIAEDSLPDIIFEGPERLVADWARRGLLVDVDDIWNSEYMENTYSSVAGACTLSDGKYYMLPVCMTTHCMAINRDIFDKVGLLSIIDDESRTWSTDDFLQAVATLTDAGYKPLEIYCADQSGDQGTRALITNLCGGTYTNTEHTAYAVSSSKNAEALKLLYNTKGITFNANCTAADAIDNFCNGDTAMVLCWNVAQELTNTVVNNRIDFDVLPVVFPTDNTTPVLQGGIWGFGIFNSEDDVRVQAAKDFVRYLTEAEEVYAKFVVSTSMWPTREIKDLYVNDSLMSEYQLFNQYFGDFYQITINWKQARAAWWQLLQEVGSGVDVKKALTSFDAKVIGD